MSKFRGLKFSGKFSSYKKTFILLAVLWLVSVAVGIWLGDSDVAKSVSRFFEELLLGISPSRATFFFELFFLLFVFIFAPTIYAPVASALAVALYGFILGAELRGLSSHRLFINFTLGALSSYLLTLFSALSIMVGITLFSKSDKKGGRLFDGVLFRCENFSTFFNYRFLITFIFVFLLFLASISAVSLLKVFLITL